MATTTPTPATEMRLALDDIIVGENARDGLDADHVEGLARSIALRGVLVPLIVRVDRGGAFHLVAGAHRVAACRKLGLADAPVVVRQRNGSAGDAAAENVLRKALTPLEEARAVQAMLNDGYTLDGAAQALGWNARLVTARAKILKLPELGQQLIGDGRLPVSAIDVVIQVHEISPPVAGAILRSIEDGWASGDRLARDPGRIVIDVLQRRSKGVFGETLHTVTAHSAKPLKLGKKLTEMIVEADRLQKQIDPYFWGTTFRFEDADVDRARAAGVLLEFADSNIPPIITDRDVYRELVKDLIPRTVETLRVKAAKKAKETAKGAGGSGDARADIEREHRAAGRGFVVRAHSVNLDLGVGLLALATVDPTSMDVARFFCYGLLGPDGSGGESVSAYDNVARTVAATGLALVFDEHRVTTEKTLKSGKPGKAKVVYVTGEKADEALWRFLGGAQTAADLYGRTIVAYAAQQYALQIVLPNSKRRGSRLPGSHNDTARKAFEALTKDALPETYKQLRRAIEREARAHTRRMDQVDAARRNTGATAPEDEGDVAGEDLESDDLDG